MRFIKGMVATGVGLLGGGLGYTLFMGYNAFVLDLWLRAIPLLFSDPGLIVNEALHGNNPPLFQGVIMVGVGVLLLALTALFVLARPLLRDLKKSVAGRKNRVHSLRMRLPRKLTAQNQGKEEHEFGDESIQDDTNSVGAKTSTISKIQQRLNQARHKDEFSQEIGEDAKPETPKRSFLQRVGLGHRSAVQKDGFEQQGVSEEDSNGAAEDRAVSSILDSEKAREAIPQFSPKRTWGSSGKTNRMRLRNIGGEEEKPSAIQSSLDTVWDTMWAKIGTMLSRKSAAPAPVSLSEEEIAHQRNTSLDAQTTDWFKSVQSGGRPVRDLIQEAIVLREGFTDELRERFVDRNSIDGAFILRLIDSWATRTDADTALEEGEDRATMREAIRAVYREKAGHIPKDDNLVPEEFQAGLDDTIEAEDGIDEEEEWARSFTQPRPEDSLVRVERSMEEGTDSAGEVSANPLDPQERIMEKLHEAVQKMYEYATLLVRVKSGEDEWPPHLEEEDYRVEEVEEIDREYSSASFAMDDDDMLAFAANSEDTAMAWLVENPSAIRKGFVEFARRLEAGEDTEEGFGDGDESADDGALAPVEDGGSEGVSEPDPLKAIGQETEQMDSEQSTPDESVDEAAERSTDIQQDGIDLGVDVPEQPLVENSTDEQGEGIDHTLPAPGDDNSDENSGAVLPVKEPVVLPQDDVHPAPTPRNIERPDLEEIARAKPMVMEWGSVSKEAGASGGTMMRLVAGKGEDKFLPVGLVHLVMQWKREEKVLRANVIFRYLEEGIWHAVADRPGRFERENGDWVEVSEGLLEHEDVRLNPTAIHIHGPGATEEVEAQAQAWKDLWVIQSTPTAAELARRISG